MYQDNSIRAASAADVPAIERFLSKKANVHRHLDWRQPLDWIVSQRFFLFLNQKDEIEALLCATPEIGKINWIRIFAYRKKEHLFPAWNALLNAAISVIQEESIDTKLLALAYHTWMIKLLELEGWKEIDRIMQFEWEGSSSRQHPTKEKSTLIRKMAKQDLQIVHGIDCVSFEPIWQQSFETMSASFSQSGYATVYEKNGEVLGFQLSTNDEHKAHLARIAVHPDHRQQHIGRFLVQDLLDYCAKKRIRDISVNTQATNLRSIALYKNMGFEKQGDTYPNFMIG
jgi:ribosomal-protein-alanine N-acetyltransferase